MNVRNARIVLTIVASVILTSTAHGWGSTPDTEAYYGELHLHTALSTDAWMNGTRKHPYTSYRFAQGDPVTLSNGAEWALSRPLDFVAITDHAESFGDLALCKQAESPVYDKPLCRAMRGGNNPEMMGRVIGGWAVEGAKRNPVTCGADGKLCIEAAKNTWQSLREAADRANRPGEFTALVAYEYSPVMIGPTGASKVHRNVIFRTGDAPDRAFSSYDGTIEDLHVWLEEECAPPCRAMTIPHNSNASSSQIFWEGRNSDGSPWSQEILERRARLEPLVEIYQGKGSSECHPDLGLTDEECGFEQWVKNCGEGERLGCSTTSDMVRDTIVRGLRIEEERGVNPHKLGFVGSTDSHLGTPGAVAEDDYQGQLGSPDDAPMKRLSGGFSTFDLDSLGRLGTTPDGGWGFMGPTKFSPGGLAAVWATENTREGIFDALARREAFSTSGPRIRVRFFGGYDLPEDAHDRRNAVAVGYRKGVPMGGDLRAAPEGKAPRFLLWASHDPESARLAKIQIVKGWVENGVERSEVFDVACSDGASPDATTGRCPDNGAGVDLATCALEGEGGDTTLGATWTDPVFDSARRAVYYARVFENPVCRWSTHDAIQIGAPLAKHVPPTIRERAWTSPIWYTP
ncbi:MAG: DUF3604 domain-containing protein [bacterium]|nr:hypothetical protein [Deltaproteobacteria bacterium]MCP4908300.1 DUF3604 domain-containing protein [bacterium]